MTTKTKTKTTTKTNPERAVPRRTVVDKLLRLRRLLRNAFVADGATQRSRGVAMTCPITPCPGEWLA